MKKQVFPLWVFAIAAVFIASAGFGVAQIARGSGVMVVLALTVVWMTIVQVRGRRLANG